MSKLIELTGEAVAIFCTNCQVADFAKVSPSDISESIEEEGHFLKEECQRCGGTVVVPPAE